MTMPSLFPQSIREQVKVIVAHCGLDTLLADAEAIRATLEFAVTAERERCAHIASVISPAAAAAIWSDEQ